METSIFLAKLMGPMLLLMGLFAAMHPERMRKIGREFLDSEALIFISGIITLPVGLAIVINHNVWEMDWRIWITVFGWLAIIAGAARILLPDVMKSIGSVMLEKTPLLIVPGLLMAALGGYLMFYGYVGAL